MLPKSDLKKIAQARLRDARVLFKGRCYDGAMYLCGYAAEMAIKARICRALHWKGYPASRKEFENFKSFKTHDLEVLLHLSGAEEKVKTQHATDWSVVAQWDPKVRYEPIGSVTKQGAELTIRSTTKLLKAL